MQLALACGADNDLLRVLTDNGVACRRCDGAAQAVESAASGGGVLVLADGYPQTATPISPDILAAAERKRLRLYVEYPAALPDLELAQPRQTEWERAVVSSDFFGSDLPPMTILAVHGCRFVGSTPKGPLREAVSPVASAGTVEGGRATMPPHIVVARVAGFDTAVYGLPSQTWPILFEHPRGNLLVATTKLSQFVTARYAPAGAWRVIWRGILSWLTAGAVRPELRWAPTVGPTFGPKEDLFNHGATRPRKTTPGRRTLADIELQAARRGARWFVNSRMFIHPDWQGELDKAAGYHDRTGPGPRVDWPCGDGRLGMLEGFSSRIDAQGNQPVRWYLRNDCMGESAGAMALADAVGAFAGSTGWKPVPPGRTIAANLCDFIYLNSELTKGPRSDPAGASYGLVGWYVPGGEGIYYGDDNARSLLGALLASAVLGCDKWDEPMLRCLLANLRTTGKLGFRGNRLDEKPLQESGWRHYFQRDITNFAPHYECYPWACFLWAWRQTGFELFLDRAASAISMTMSAYPNMWRWANGIQQERARMLLPLSWLVRAQDSPRHRQWLRQVATDVLSLQDACGAIGEEIGAPGLGAYGPPKSNEEYGSNEAALIQTNGDPLTDLLYTTNFAFLGLHEAAAATGDEFYRQAADRLAEFLCRIQIRSESHPELDGGWFRAVDHCRWEYLASNADSGWGAWSIETGWTQAWIVSVLALRQTGTSLWEITSGSRIGRQLEKVLPTMLPRAFVVRP